MTGFRPPIVAGMSVGVGTTTLSLALHGTDAGTTTADADILVCRSTAESIDRATRIADLAEPGRYPVLVVTLACAERRPPPRVAELEEVWAAVIPAPHVGRWSGIVDPYREAAGLLGNPREQLPRPVRRYLDAVTRAARLVAESGRLTAPRAGVPRADPILHPFVPVPVRPMELPAPTPDPSRWSGRALPPHRPETVDRTVQGPPLNPAVRGAFGPVAHPAPEYRIPLTTADLGPFAHPSPERPPASASPRPSRTASDDGQPSASASPRPSRTDSEVGRASVSSTIGDLGTSAEPTPEHREPAAEGPHDRPAPPHPGADGHAPAPADPAGWSDARIPIRDDVSPSPEAGNRAWGPGRATAPASSTVDSTGCGETPTLELPELRPVRGIRVLAIGGVSG